MFPSGVKKGSNGWNLPTFNMVGEVVACWFSFSKQTASLAVTRLRILKSHAVHTSVNQGSADLRVDRFKLLVLTVSGKNLLFNLEIEVVFSDGGNL